MKHTTGTGSVPLPEYSMDGNGTRALLFQLSLKICSRTGRENRESEGERTRDAENWLQKQPQAGQVLNGYMHDEEP